MNDNYFHQDLTLMYIPENIPGPEDNSPDYINIVECFNSQLSNSCQCDVCEPPNCSCLKKCGSRNYVISNTEDKIYLIDNKLQDDIICPIIECNDLCACDSNCGNRLVQKGPLRTLYIGICQNKNKGLGLFCSDVIYKGTFVCEYAGEVITKTEANNRQQKNMLRKDMNYIFCLNEHGNDGITQTFIDPSKFGNIGRYANHSCDPNCAIIPVRVNIPIPKLALFACKNISPHTEITFNYGCYKSSDIMPHEGIDRTKCLCGTTKCKGWMPFQMF